VTDSTVICELNSSWRVIADDGPPAQWILQSYHDNDGWRGRSCSPTLQALERCLDIHVDSDIDPAALVTLGLVAPPKPIRKRKPKKLKSTSPNDEVEKTIGPDVIAELNPRWRVVTDGAQWMLQRLDDEWGWVPRSRARTRYGLQNVIRLHAGDVDAEAIAVVSLLPLHIDWPVEK
jgi:hypothetical protein